MVIRLLLIVALLFPFAAAQAEEGAWMRLKEDGAVILFRHANAPGTGDPAGFVLGECSTQRNLDDKGRAEARAIGDAFRAQGIKVGRVLSSQWCRSRETADLAFPGQVTEEPSFNSFFGDRSAEPEATAAARNILSEWKGPGALVVVTHQVNITALTGICPKPGRGGDRGDAGRHGRGAGPVAAACGAVGLFPHLLPSPQRKLGSSFGQ